MSEPQRVPLAETFRALPPQPGTALSGLLLSVVATFLATAPLWWVEFAPLHDLPFHAARILLLRDALSGGFFTQFYELNTLFLPNVGMDLVALGLFQALSLPDAVRAFLVVLVFVMISGANALHRTLFGTNGLSVPIAALLSYNAIFVLGFLNYLLGVGLLVWSVALFLRMRGRPAALRFALGLLLGLVLIFTHLVAFVLYGLVVAGLELQAAARMLRAAGRARAAVMRLLVSGLPLVLILGLFVALSPTAGASSPPPATGNLFGVFSFDLGRKLWILKRTLAGGQNAALDFASVAIAGVLLVLLLLLCRVRFAWEAAVPFVLLGLAYLVAPDLLMGAAYLDLRLPVGILFLAAGCVHFAPRTDRMRLGLTVLLLVVVTLRSGVLTRDWLRYEVVQKEFVQAYACLPRGSVLFVARPRMTVNAIWQGHWEPPIKHIASLASVTDGVFVPQTFADPTQQPIRVRPELRAIYAFQSPNPIVAESVATLEATVAEIRRLVAAARPGQDAWPTYLLLLEPGLIGHPTLGGTTRIADRNLFSLYRLDTAGEGAAAPGPACPAAR